MRTTLRRPVVMGVLAALTTLTVAACSAPEDDVPAAAPVVAASPSPSLDAAEQLEAENVAAAEETVKNYYHDVAEQGRAGYSDWEFVLVPYWSGEVLADQSERYARHHANGRTTRGQTEVVSMKVLDYTPSPGGAFDTVRLEVCTDVSALRAFEDGEELERPADANLRFVTDLLLRNQNGERWTIHERTATGERAC
ncbi:hypothetical protein [Isoptericola sp. NPDC019482]|uniref:hypothetical protein n=1 Tax=Isoptericola sp. NPDC019482 TaxID=3154688 RepID=UPI00347A403D